MKDISERKSKLYMTVLLAFTLVLLLVPASFSWYKEITSNFGEAVVTGSIRASYFHSGNGLSDFQVQYTDADHNEPDENARMDEFGNASYEIYTPEEFYNLAWLQYIGLFEDEHYYFHLSRDIDMTGYELPPVGTEGHPFAGTFEGNGYQISNLKVCGGVEDATSSSGVLVTICDVGVFGYVGEDASIKNTYIENVTISLEDASTANVDNHLITSEAIAEVARKSHEVKGEDVVFVGYIAGHIQTASTCENVYVNNCSIVGGTKAISNYSYFGCVDDNDLGISLPTLGSAVADLRTSGSDAGFGGSLDMRNVHQRLDTIWNGDGTNTYATVPQTYISAETHIINEVTGEDYYTDRVSSNKPANPTGSGVTFTYKYYTTPGAGKYFYHDRTDMANYDFMCMFGDSSYYPKTLTTKIYKDDFRDAYYIYDGTYFLGEEEVAPLSRTTVQDDATKWMKDAQGRIYALIAGKFYYLTLSGLNVSIQNTDPTYCTRWNLSGDNSLYVYQDGIPWYLVNENGNWVISPFRDYHIAGDANDNYMATDGTNITGTTDATVAVKWMITEQSSYSIFKTYVGGQPRYLTVDSDGKLVLSQIGMNWYKDGNGYYTNFGTNPENYYLVYNNGWKLETLAGSYITDGNDNYLSTDGTVITNVTTQNESPKWKIITDSETGNTTIAVGIAGVDKYLAVNNGEVVLSDTAYNWLTDGNMFYYQENGMDYYLIYDDKWDATVLSGTTISVGDNYLGIGETGIENQVSSQRPTFWYFEDAGDNVAVYTYYMGMKVYLAYDMGTMSLTLSIDPTPWERSGDTLLTVPGMPFFLGYENGWILDYLVTTVIKDLNTDNYLAADLTNTTDPLLAANWDYNSVGYLSEDTGAGRKYVTSHAGELSLTDDAETRWTFDGTTGHFYCNENEKTYFLNFVNGNWQSVEGKQHIYYLNNGTKNFLNIQNGNIVSGTDEASATLWTIDMTNGSAVIHANINGNETYLATYQVSAPNGITGGNYNQGLTLVNATNARTTWTYANGKFYQTLDSTVGWFGSNKTQADWYLVFTNQAWGLNKSDSNSTVSFEYYADGINFNANMGIPTPNLDVNDITLTLSTETGDNSMSVPEIRKTPGQGKIHYQTDALPEKKQIYVQTGPERTRGGYQTYFPLRIASAGEDDYDEGDPFRASEKNTGYIISAGNSVDNESEAIQKYAGDIRISYFPIQNNITNSISTTNNEVTFKTIRTIDSTGRHDYDLNNGSEVFNEAIKQLRETLTESVQNGENSVYGLHFMDSQISKDRYVVADQVTLFDFDNQAGKTVEKYPLPEDCIDFNVYERGTISFFAGTYFTGNNAFFSLHQIFRDSDYNITSIKEIKYVYQNVERGKRDPAVYQYTDGSFSDGLSGIPDGYTMVFDTTWITTSSYITKDNYIYYFEIPCNPGEYALGSVTGRTGAYLIYLDIAANGGDFVSTMVSDEGNGVADAFKVEYRSTPSTVERNIFQFSVTAPESASEDDFSVKINYQQVQPKGSLDKSDKANKDLYEGLYTLVITNKTSESVDIVIFMCDDDDDYTNVFPYAYRIQYENGDTPLTYITTEQDTNTWKRVNGFRINPTGEPEDISISDLRSDS